MTLQEWRKQAGWTQRRLGEELERLGAGKVSQQRVNTWEHGAEPPARAYEAIRRLTKGKVGADSFGTAGAV